MDEAMELLHTSGSDHSGVSLPAKSNPNVFPEAFTDYFPFWSAPLMHASMHLSILPFLPPASLHLPPLTLSCLARKPWLRAQRGGEPMSAVSLGLYFSSVWTEGALRRRRTQQTP